MRMIFTIKIVSVFQDLEIKRKNAVWLMTGPSSIWSI